MSVDISKLRHAGVAIEDGFNQVHQLTDRIPFTGESFTPEWERKIRDYLAGKVGAIDSDVIGKKWSGSFDGYLVHDIVSNGQAFGVDTLLAAAIGSGTYHAGSGYVRMLLADELSAPISLGIDKVFNSNIYCFSSCFIRTFEIKSSASDGRMSFTVEFQPHAFLHEGADWNTITNTGVLPKALVYKPIRILLFPDIQFLIDPIETGVPSSKLSISEISSFKWDNALSDHEFATVDTSHEDGYLPIAPVRSGERKVTLDIAVPRSSATTLRDYMLEETPLNIKILVDNASAGIFIIKIPYAKIIKTDDTGSGADVIRPKYSFECYMGESYNDGAGNTAFHLEGTDNQDILAEFAIEHKTQRTGDIF